MHDGMPYSRIQGQGHEPIQGSSIENLQSREVDRQSPTGLILFVYVIVCSFQLYIIYIHTPLAMLQPIFAESVVKHQPTSRFNGP